MKDARARAQDFWTSLTPEEAWQLGDDLVFGCVDWQDWGFGKKPDRAFRDALDDVRMDWEQESA